jgi:hypothetical protein
MPVLVTGSYSPIYREQHGRFRELRSISIKLMYASHDRLIIDDERSY